MPFIKLDVGILDSSLWYDVESRDLFLTALLMASPKEFKEPIVQISATGEPTGWSALPGWYGFVSSAASVIIRRAGFNVTDQTLEALERLGKPDPESRTADFDGRRLVRVVGGFVVLNYVPYRDRDYTTAERQRRFRARKKQQQTIEINNAVDVTEREERDAVLQ